ncbi:MAG: fimbrillin family protein [Bacteroidales bacterium]
MKTKKIAFMTLSGLLMASCANEMDQMTEKLNEPNTIGFDTYSQISKGHPITGNTTGDNVFAINGRRFHVTAYVGNEVSNQYLNAPIEYNNGIWNYVKAEDKAYWPNKNETLNFYAVYPDLDFHGTNENKGTVSYDNTKKSMNISYTVPTTIGDQQDLMYAIEIDKTKPTSGTNVNLNFKHALNQIHFLAKTDAKDLKVTIAENGIAVCNIYQTGSLAVTNNSSAWECDASSIIDYTQNADSVTPIVYENTSRITNEKNLLMLIPQEVSPWIPNPATTGNNASNPNQKGSYLKISCRIWMANGNAPVYLHGNKNEFADIYVPFKGEHMNEIGKKIQYTLIFGGGYTDEGQPILSPITFETEVTDWTNIENTDIEANNKPSTPAK